MNGSSRGTESASSTAPVYNEVQAASIGGKKTKRARKKTGPGFAAGSAAGPTAGPTGPETRQNGPVLGPEQRQGKADLQRNKKAGIGGDGGSSGSSGSSSENSSNTNEWPQSLQSFVQRCFNVSNTFSADKKEEFQRQLMEIVKLAIDTKAIWSNDWDNQQLPIIHGCASVKLQGSEHFDAVSSSVGAKAVGSVEAGVVGAGAGGKRTRTPVSSHKPYGASGSSPVSSPAPSKGKFDSSDRKKQRLERFGTESPQPTPRHHQPAHNALSAIVGTCQDLEKHYLRLTSEPEPHRVRPEPVLHRSIAYILDKYKHKQAEELRCGSAVAGGNTAYGYVNDQFKSIRQDLTVQHIKNDFTIYIYETHGRIAIENNDLGEFNQCQSQLKFLYNLKRKQGGVIDEKFMNLELEFLCYRILYMLMTGNDSEIYKIKLEVFLLDANELARRKKVRFFKCLDAVFTLQSCIIRGNFYHFFRIYRFLKSKSYMQLGCKLIENFLIEKQRIRSLNIVSRLYRMIGTQYLKEVLDFANKEEDALHAFLGKFKLTAFLKNDEFDCVQSRGVILGILVQQGFRKIDIKGQV